MLVLPADFQCHVLYTVCISVMLLVLWKLN